jgi:hypothetical protein
MDVKVLKLFSGAFTMIVALIVRYEYCFPIEPIPISALILCCVRLFPVFMMFYYVAVDYHVVCVSSEA